MNIMDKSIPNASYLFQEKSDVSDNFIEVS